MTETGMKNTRYRGRRYPLCMERIKITLAYEDMSQEGKYWRIVDMNPGRPWLDKCALENRSRITRRAHTGHYLIMI
jgi:hypothetical protein